MDEKGYLSAKEAAAELGIRVQTLYAYVSRGLIGSEATSGKTRARRYAKADVAALKQQQLLRRNPDKAMTQVLQFGMPVLESAITLIENGRFYYRGHDVLQLAQRRPFEAVAMLLWLGELTSEWLIFEQRPSSAEVALYNAIAPQLTYLSPMAAFQTVLPLVAANDLAGYDLTATAVARTGARIVRWLTTIAIGNQTSGSIAKALQEGWRCHNLDAINLLNGALVLCADHELNISAFTARCVASARATPYAVVIAGLSALQGARHGGQTAQAATLLRQIDGVQGVRPAILGYLQRGEAVPGFGHPLYPQGDPRGRLLLDLMAEADVDETAVGVAQAVVREMDDALGKKPNLDFGLAALAAVLGLPVDAGSTLFAIGRTVGWLGHAIEQYQHEGLIRPRAKYVGRMTNPPHPMG